MSNTKHTPGPWVVSPFRPCEIRTTVENGAARTVAIVSNKEALPNREVLANVKLIAAAPELLEALEEMFVGFENIQYPEDVGPYTTFNGHVKSTIEKARAAIKTATA